jgi:hypothetical protein
MPSKDMESKLIDTIIPILILNEFGIKIAPEDLNVNDDVVKAICQNLRMYVLQKISDRSGVQNAQWLVSKIEEESTGIYFNYFKEILKKELIQIDADRDELIINLTKRLADLMQKSKNDERNTIVVNGSIGQGSAVGSNPVVTNIFNAPGRDEVKEGINCLQWGRESLETGDYETAKKNLNEAVSKLHGDRVRKEVAQAKYLLAIALLEGKRPFSQKLSVMQSVENLLLSATTLHLLYSYVLMLALCKRDFARNGLPRLVSEAQELLVKASSIRSTSEDLENLKILAACQPGLMGDFLKI